MGKRKFGQISREDRPRFDRRTRVLLPPLPKAAKLKKEPKPTRRVTRRHYNSNGSIFEAAVILFLMLVGGLAFIASTVPFGTFDKLVREVFGA